MAKTCMGSYEISKHKKDIGEGEKWEDIGFCLSSLWLIERWSWPLESQWKWRV